MLPQFDYNDGVRVVRNVRNDGTYPGLPTGHLLVRRGATGFVRDVGTFLQDQLIYTVVFLETGIKGESEARVVGCREQELIAIDAPWTPSRFETREKVCATMTLAVGGELRAEKGTVGEVMKVLRGTADGEAASEVQYQVHFPGWVLQVPEHVLEELEDTTPVGQEVEHDYDT